MHQSWPQDGKNHSPAARSRPRPYALPPRGRPDRAVGLRARRTRARAARIPLRSTARRRACEASGWRSRSPRSEREDPRGSPIALAECSARELVCNQEPGAASAADAPPPNAQRPGLNLDTGPQGARLSATHPTSPEWKRPQRSRLRHNRRVERWRDRWMTVTTRRVETWS